MPPEFINLTAENLADEHLCCIIRSKKPHPGVESKRQWLSDQSFAKKFGFETVDATGDGYELLALSFDGTKPKFMDSAKKQEMIYIDPPYNPGGDFIYADDFQCVSHFARLLSATQDTTGEQE